MICKKEQCTGCFACFNACSKEAIVMSFDQEGFQRPVIDAAKCDDCGACKHVCPILHLTKPKNSVTPKVYACWNKDDTIRFESSSGGVFSALAGHVLNGGGVVFGAAFDSAMRVKHIAVENGADLGRLRGSKYVQSDIGNTFDQVRQLLRQNKHVLFSGTPCQVAGLKKYLGNLKKNLLTCDLICQGVPSSGLFAKYIDDLEKRFQAKIVSINMRHKRKGWESPSTVAYFGNGDKRVLTGYADSFLFGFNRVFTLRPSCYLCPYTHFDREGDITLADFWGIGKSSSFRYDTKKGISLVLINSENGQRLFEESSSGFNLEARSMEEVKHRRLFNPIPEPEKRKQFFVDYLNLDYEELAKKHLVGRGLKYSISRFIPRMWLLYIRQQLSKVSNKNVKAHS